MNYLARDITLTLDIARCTGCGRCVEVCPRGVFGMEGRQVRMAKREACIECGACALNCPAGALSVQSGVGCAEAIINGLLTGGEACCGESCCCAEEVTREDQCHD
jgi:NAD-dependent dihydropyrimidine dehydrogenase PreA subunit